MSTYSVKEELANIITHAIGILLGIVFFVALLIQAISYGNIWHIISYSIFSISLVLLYTSSTTYHFIKDPGLKSAFRKVDHSAIYLLIAGSYTPFLLVSLRDSVGWHLFAIVWLFALIGIIVKIFTRIKSKWASAIIYIIMGWLVVIAYRQVIDSVPNQSIIYLAIGGLFYTLGVLFYVWKNLNYHHAIWHLFVLAGSTSHFLAVYYLLK
jgi:hemolysin III